MSSQLPSPLLKICLLIVGMFDPRLTLVIACIFLEDGSTSMLCSIYGKRLLKLRLAEPDQCTQYSWRTKLVEGTFKIRQQNCCILLSKQLEIHDNRIDALLWQWNIEITVHFGYLHSDLQVFCCSSYFSLHMWCACIEIWIFNVHFFSLPK